MRSVGVLEAKTNLSALVEEIEGGGEPVAITRHGKPVAKLVAADAEVLPAGRRRASGAELLARLDEIGKLEPPEFANMTWEDWKVIARS